MNLYLWLFSFFLFSPLKRKSLGKSIQMFTFSHTCSLKCHDLCGHVIKWRKAIDGFELRMNGLVFNKFIKYHITIQRCPLELFSIFSRLSQTSVEIFHSKLQYSDNEAKWNETSLLMDMNNVPRWKSRVKCTKYQKGIMWKSQVKNIV